MSGTCRRPSWLTAASKARARKGRTCASARRSRTRGLRRTRAVSRAPAAQREWVRSTPVTRTPKRCARKRAGPPRPGADVEHGHARRDGRRGAPASPRRRGRRSGPDPTPRGLPAGAVRRACPAQRARGLQHLRLVDGVTVVEIDDESAAGDGMRARRRVYGEAALKSPGAYGRRSRFHLPPKENRESHDGRRGQSPEGWSRGRRRLSVGDLLHRRPQGPAHLPGL